MDPTDLCLDYRTFLDLQYAMKRRNKDKGSEGKKDHWMDWAKDKYDVGGVLPLQYLSSDVQVLKTDAIIV